MDFADDASNTHILHADEAWKLTERKEKVKDVNYSLTFQRLMRSIEVAAKQGYDGLEFEAPAFVLDGCIGDPIVLARQLTKKLKTLGYTIKRTDALMEISWNMGPNKGKNKQHS